MNITYYNTYDLPVPYKNIKIYPITVKDYFHFNTYSQCLTLDKNSIPDVKIISMTELEYIYHASEEDIEKKPYILWLDRLFSLCLKDEDFSDLEKSIKRYGYNENNRPTFVIGKDIYASEDFEEIRNIICEQNLIELPDKTISKEVRDSLEKAREYKNKISGIKSPPFEEYLISVSMVTGWTLDYIYSMTIRKFLKTIERYNNFVHYKIYLAASMSGMVEFKDKSFIKHWLTSLEKDKYADVSMDLDALQGKISLEDAKK